MALFITSRDVARLLTMDDYIAALEQAYGELGRGEGNMLPRIKVDAGAKAGFMKILPGALAAEGIGGMHVYTGGQGNFLKQIFMYDLVSGNLEAVIEADRLGWLVPGAVSAVATKQLAPKNARRLGLFGSGRQAQAQLLALAHVCELDVVRVYSPDQGHRESFCEEMGRLLKLNCLPAASPEEVLDDAQIVSTATTTRTPVFAGAQVKPGTHINAIGAHDPGRREVDGLCVQRSVVIADSLDRAVLEEGALLLAAAEGLIELPHIYAELSEIVAGKKPGRRDDREVTLFLSGATAIEYLALGRLVYARAREAGMGQQIILERDEGVPKSFRGKRQ